MKNHLSFTNNDRDIVIINSKSIIGLTLRKCCLEGCKEVEFMLYRRDNVIHKVNELQCESILRQLNVQLSNGISRF